MGTGWGSGLKNATILGDDQAYDDTMGQSAVADPGSDASATTGAPPAGIVLTTTSGVTLPTSGIVPTVSLTAGTEAQLNAALISIDSGGSIAASGTNYVITLTNDITLNTELEGINLPVGASLTLNGGGHAIDGAHAWRGLFVFNGTVGLNALTIENAVAKGGAGGAGGGGGGAGLGGGLFIAGANTIAGRPRRAITFAIVKVLPEPVTPSSTWVRSCRLMPSTSSRIAVGWSPFGSYSDLMTKGCPPLRWMMSLSRRSCSSMLLPGVEGTSIVIGWSG